MPLRAPSWGTPVRTPSARHPFVFLEPTDTPSRAQHPIVLQRSEPTRPTVAPHPRIASAHQLCAVAACATYRSRRPRPARWAWCSGYSARTLAATALRRPVSSAGARGITCSPKTRTAAASPLTYCRGRFPGGPSRSLAAPAPAGHQPPPAAQAEVTPLPVAGETASSRSSAVGAHRADATSSPRRCSSDYGCSLGQKCVKDSMQYQGVCAEGVNSYGAPPSSESMGPGQGQCSFDTECPIGFRCIKNSGGLRGNCMK